MLRRMQFSVVFAMLFAALLWGRQAEAVVVNIDPGSDGEMFAFNS